MPNPSPYPKPVTLPKTLTRRNPNKLSLQQEYGDGIEVHEATTAYKESQGEDALMTMLIRHAW
jgi:hypothetical protein